MRDFTLFEKAIGLFVLLVLAFLAYRMIGVNQNIGCRHLDSAGISTSELDCPTPTDEEDNPSE